MLVLACPAQKNLQGLVNGMRGDVNNCAFVVNFSEPSVGEHHGETERQEKYSLAYSNGPKCLQRTGHVALYKPPAATGTGAEAFPWLCGTRRASDSAVSVGKRKRIPTSSQKYAL